MTANPYQISQFLDSVFSAGPVWVYLVVFGACFIENILPPFPGDSFIAAAGALVAADRLELVVTFPLIIVAGLSSVMVLYYLGRRYGRSYFMKKDFKYLSAADILKVEQYLNRWGAAILLVSRFVIGFRSAIAVGAGIGRYQAVRMLVYSLISYMLFAGLVMYLAMVAVDHFELIVRYFSAYHNVVWPVAIVLVLQYVVRRYRRLRESA